MSQSQLHIVIVNWNAGNLLRECLQSIADHGGEWVDRVVVVDNGSTDGSANLQMPALPLEVIRLPTNLGFAAASNVGAAGAQSQYILLLNPDTRLERGTLCQALEFMRSPGAHDIGICGIRLHDDHGEVQRHCARFPTGSSFVAQSLGLSRLFPRVFPPVLMEQFDHLSSRRVDHVIGAFYLIRHDLWRLLGGLDERFFVYLEDLDLSKRAAALGYGAYYLAEAKAHHKGGGTSRQVMARRLFYALRSRILYAAKHFSPGGSAATAAATLLIEPLIRMAWSAVHRSREEAMATGKAYLLLFCDLGRIWLVARRSSGSHAEQLSEHGNKGA